MSTDRGQSPEPRDVDAEFARMLESEGLQLRPGQAPREPAASEHPAGQDDGGPDGPGEDTLWPLSPDSPPEPPSAESVARSRAAHPAAGGRPAPGPRDPAPRELDDDEVLYGDFEAPDPDLPTPSDAAMWSWTALLGGFVLMLIVAVTPSLPGPLGWLGGLATLGGLISLLLRAPREHHGDREDGAEL